MKPIYQDINYSAQTSGMSFTVSVGSEEIYKGKASAYPDGKIEIPMNKICSQYLDSSLPDFRNISDSAISMADACKEFTLKESGVTLSSYTFFNDWSYETGEVDNKILSNPINGHMDSRMKILYSVLKNNAGNICYTGIIEPFVEINPLSYNAASNSGTTTFSVSANTNYSAITNDTWLSVSPNTGISGFTTITVGIEENTVVSSRTGNISVGDKTFTINQSGATPVPTGSTNIIYYTSTDGNIVTPYSSGIDVFGAHIFSNTYSGGQGQIVFEGNVTKIGHYAFMYRSSLAEITIPNSVTIIGDNAFNSCDSLTGITIPDSVTSIGGQAFQDCSGMTSVIIGNSVTSIGSYAFQGCSSLTGITIPSSVTSIGNDAFFGCESLTGITIPNSVTSIGDWVFCNCSGMTSAIIPNSVTSIGAGVFNNCYSLTDVTIPDSATSIGDWAFTYCSLTGITIPNSVISIGKYAICGCESLNTINYTGTMAQWNAITKGEDWKLYVPATVVHCTDGDVIL